VTSSIGVLTCVEPPSTVEELIKLADDSIMRPRAVVKMESNTKLSESKI